MNALHKLKYYISSFHDLIFYSLAWVIERFLDANQKNYIFWPLSAGPLCAGIITWLYLIIISWIKYLLIIQGVYGNIFEIVFRLLYLIFFFAPLIYYSLCYNSVIKRAKKHHYDRYVQPFKTNWKNCTLDISLHVFTNLVLFFYLIYFIQNHS